MKQIFDSLLEKLRTSLWPLPALIALGCLCLSQLSLRLNRVGALRQFSEQYLPVSDNALQNILTAIAGSVVSFGGVVLSMTMVSITLASGQFGPKVLREYLNNTLAKLTLGLFIGTFVFCIVTLTTLPAVTVPGLTVLTALSLALLSFMLFVVFIHHTTLSLQADRIVRSIAVQLEAALALYCDHRHTSDKPALLGRWQEQAARRPQCLLRARRSGYLESVDYAAAEAILQEHKALLEICCRPGEFLIEGQILGTLYYDDNHDCASAITDQFLLAPLRTPVQDPEFAITQITQIAERALSPGVNDPGTAITCIDWLVAAIAGIIDRELPGELYCSDENDVRIKRKRPDFDDFFDITFDTLREHARGNRQVLLCLIRACATLAGYTRRPARLASLQTLLDSLAHTALKDADCPQDERKLRTALQAAQSAIGTA
ncbi:DUF2254 domain-containing protein [Granulosicoccaceae sp. 1_MG-2023]|nr:DUF2254 domain-containing protein [Granulosicoccaceae sp. 1_MG-2023]